MLPEHRPAAQPAHPSPASSVEAVDRILAYTDTAVASIVRRTEHQVREIAAAADAQSASEALVRREQIAQLRRELTDRASALAVRYEAILDQLDAAEVALATWAGPARPQAGPADPRVDAIKMTLRERQRISVAYEETPAPPVQAARPVAFGETQSRRRWWRPWQREAA